MSASIVADAFRIDQDIPVEQDERGEMFDAVRRILDDYPDTSICDTRRSDIASHDVFARFLEEMPLRPVPMRKGLVLARAMELNRDDIVRTLCCRWHIGIEDIKEALDKRGLQAAEKGFLNVFRALVDVYGAIGDLFHVAQALLAAINGHTHTAFFLSEHCEGRGGELDKRCIVLLVLHGHIAMDYLPQCLHKEAIFKAASDGDIGFLEHMADLGGQYIIDQNRTELLRMLSIRPLDTMRRFCHLTNVTLPDITYRPPTNGADELVRNNGPLSRRNLVRELGRKEGLKVVAILDDIVMKVYLDNGFLFSQLRRSALGGALDSGNEDTVLFFMNVYGVDLDEA